MASTVNQGRMPGTYPEVLRHLEYRNSPTGGFTTLQNQGSTEYPQTKNQPGSTTKRPRAFEHLSTDKPGKELDENAGIWNLYVDEAQEYDNELVRGCQQSLDTLLLFAALFSAIQTAFLIESKDLLQQDPNETTAALLLLIAQSQNRIEQGLSPPPLNATIHTPSFVAPHSARWINGIWFTSLALSLSAALVAMLAKEWLTTYLSSRPHAARKHALLRQSRFEGLDGWWALHIIALLPTLLHISLLFFSIGLVIYLWTLDIASAIILTFIISAMFLFYVGTGVLGAVYEYCPFVTGVSSYTQKGISRILGSQKPETDQKIALSERDISALFWLINHARDPEVIDCSHQALAALRSLFYRAPSSYENGMDGSKPSGNIYASGSILIDILNFDELESPHSKTVVSIMDSSLARFKQLVSGSPEFSIVGAHIGASLSRYINVIMLLKTLVKADPDSDRDQLTHVSSFKVFKMIQRVWRCKLPLLALSADHYASLLIAELEAIHMAIEDASFDSRSFSTIVVLDEQELGIIEQSPELMLAAFYSRWLMCYLTLLHFHAQGKTPMEPHLLAGLRHMVARTFQSSTRTATIQTEMLSFSRRTQHRVRSMHPPATGNAVTQKNCGTEMALAPFHFTNLVRLLYPHAYMHEETLAQIRVAAWKAYILISPEVLQVLQSGDGSGLWDALTSLEELLKSSPNPRVATFITIRFSMRAISQLSHPDQAHPQNPEIIEAALVLVNQCINEGLNAKSEKENEENPGVYQAISYHIRDFSELLKLAEANMDSPNNVGSVNWNPPVIISLVNILSAFFGEHESALCFQLPTQCLITLIRLISRIDSEHTPGSSKSVDQIFKAIQQKIQTLTPSLLIMAPVTTSNSLVAESPSSPWNNIRLRIQRALALETNGSILKFLLRTQGLKLLLSIGSRNNYAYADSIVATIVTVVEALDGLSNANDSSVTNSPTSFPAIQQDDLPVFIEVIKWALGRLSSEGGEPTNPTFLVGAANVIVNAIKHSKCSKHDLQLGFLRAALTLEQKRESANFPLTAEQLKRLIDALRVAPTLNSEDPGDELDGIDIRSDNLRQDFVISFGNTKVTKRAPEITRDDPPE